MCGTGLVCAQLPTMEMAFEASFKGCMGNRNSLTKLYVEAGETTVLCVRHYFLPTRGDEIIATS